MNQEIKPNCKKGESNKMLFWSIIAIGVGSAMFGMSVAEFWDILALKQRCHLPLAITCCVLGIFILYIGIYYAVITTT
jgi:hypothetical protein